MAEQRLIDANALREDWLENGENEYVYDTNSFLESLDDAPTIDPESLPIVRQLREELARVTAERDTAVKDLKKWSVCATCKSYRPKSRKSNCQLKTAYLSGGNWAGCSKWKWRGPQKEE